MQCADEYRAPPAQVMRVLDDILKGVSVHLSGPTNISKMIQHQRLQNLLQVNYTRGRQARRRPTGYPPSLWNLYEAVRHEEVRTNNLSEGRHNRFATDVEKAHPSIFNFLGEIQKEQADTDSMLT